MSTTFILKCDISVYFKRIKPLSGMNIISNIAKYVVRLALCLIRANLNLKQILCFCTKTTKTLHYTHLIKQFAQDNLFFLKKGLFFAFLRIQKGGFFVFVSYHLKLIVEKCILSFNNIILQETDINSQCSHKNPQYIIT